MKATDKLARVRRRARALGLAFEAIDVSSRRSSKFVVTLPSGRRVHFGQSGAEDFLDHKDADRRRRYLARASGIRDGRGRLTKDTPTSANFWSIRLLW